MQTGCLKICHHSKNHQKENYHQVNQFFFKGHWSNGMFASDKADTVNLLYTNIKKNDYSVNMNSFYNDLDVKITLLNLNIKDIQSKDYSTEIVSLFSRYPLHRQNE